MAFKVDDGGFVGGEYMIRRDVVKKHSWEG
jgi:hypothetical protein